MAPGGGRWSCSEGDRIVIDAVAEHLPVLSMAGRAIMPESLAKEGDGFRARFEVFIDTWAGVTTLDASNGAEQLSLSLDVRPHEHKLGEEAFDAMLAELSEHSAGLVWGLSPGSAAGSAAAGALAVVHPAVLATQLPRFERLVAAFLANPPTSTVRISRTRPLDLARRADVATLRRLGRRPALLRALQGNSTAAGFVDPRSSIEQPDTVASTDHPTTRYLAYLLRQLLCRFRGSACSLRIASGRPFPEPATEAHAQLLATVLDRGAERMEALLRCPLLRSVDPEPLGDSALQELADQPSFGALHRVGRRLLDPGLAYGPGGSIESSLKHTYDLFELFVLFRLMGELPRALGPGWSPRPTKAYRFAGREERPRNLTNWWLDGPDELTVELRYQQWFPRAKPAPDGRMFSSLSGVAIPDYILVVRRAMKAIGWVILDAKYRSGQQAVDAGLADVHRYRDALRVRGLRASGAFVIVPQLRDENAPYVTADFLEHHAFGALRLFEEGWLEMVVKVLLGNGGGKSPGSQQ